MSTRLTFSQLVNAEADTLFDKGFEGDRLQKALAEFIAANARSKAFLSEMSAWVAGEFVKNRRIAYRGKAIRQAASAPIASAIPSAAECLKARVVNSAARLMSMHVRGRSDLKLGDATKADLDAVSVKLRVEAHADLVHAEFYARIARDLNDRRVDQVFSERRLADLLGLVRHQMNTEPVVAAQAAPANRSRSRKAA